MKNLSNSSKKKPVRKPILTVENVLVKVPKEEGEYFKYVPSKEIPGPNGKCRVTIPRHYVHGYMARTNPQVIVFRHFYNLPEDKFGKSITAKLKVYEKKANGLTYILVDYYYQECEVSKYEQKFWDLNMLNNLNNGAKVVKIPRTTRAIVFKPIEPRQ